MGHGYSAPAPNGYHAYRGHVTMDDVMQHVREEPSRGEPTVIKATIEGAFLQPIRCEFAQAL